MKGAAPRRAAATPALCRLHHAAWRVGLARLAAALALPAAFAAPPDPACPAPPAALIEIRSANLYGEGGPRAAPDPAAQAERERLTADLNRFMREVAEGAGTTRGAACALAALQAWAAQGALLGALANEAARKELIWNSAGLQLAYLRLRPGASAAQAAQIEPWLRALAQRVDALYGRVTAANNVQAWVALTQAAQAALSGEPAAWARAEALRAPVLAAVDAEGWLAPELARGRRALAYHLFALAPLLAHEALRRQYGPPRVDAPAPAALARLLRASRQALADPAARDRLAERAGAAQDAPSERQRRSVAWLGACLDLGVPPPAGTPPFERWLGGSVQGLCPRGLALNSAPPSPAPASRAPEP